MTVKIFNNSTGLTGEQAKQVSDHGSSQHGAAVAPQSVLVQTAAAGTSESVARADHRHNVSTGTPSSVLVQTNSAGTATSLARSDHKHNVTTGTPSDVLVQTAAAGTATSLARSDHKHNVTTGTGVGLTPGGTNSAGTATSLARADHTHALPDFGAVAGTFAEGNHQHSVGIVRNSAATSSGSGTATNTVLRGILDFVLTTDAPYDGLLVVHGSSGLWMASASGTMWLGLGISINDGDWANRRFNPAVSQITQLPFATSFQEFVTQGDKIHVRMTCHHSTSASIVMNWTYAYLDAYIIPINTG